MKSSRTRRAASSVNAGSMADIAFLLLIFFLVTTVILNEKGILVKLPKWEKDPPKKPLNERNVLNVKIRQDNLLFVEGNLAKVEHLSDLTKTFVENPYKLKKYAEKPTKAIVSLQHDRGTSYNTYLQVYDAIKAGYQTLWEEKALMVYHRPYRALKHTTQKKIRDQYPMVISEAEPFDVEGINPEAFTIK